MSDSGFFTSAASSPFLPIVAAMIRGLVGIASGAGFTWAATVSGDQATMIATAVVAGAMLAWSGWQKIAAVRASRRSQVAAAVASFEQGAPVTVTETPVGQPNVATRVSAAEAAAAPSVPAGVKPSPAPRPAG